jgi:GalNAc5-diNAcBac-PP-undecaprenol beta-1,3-glucosyltransferase
LRDPVSRVFKTNASCADHAHLSILLIIMARNLEAAVKSGRAPFITVGLASYERSALLKRAIQSIKNQEYRNLEILISDNGSTDPEVIRLIKDFAAEDSRVKYLLHPSNKGPFFNFRTLLESATGEYFIWLADDDFWSEKFLYNLLHHAIESNAALTYGKAVIVDIELSDADRVGKELRTEKKQWRCLINFVQFDTDGIVYGLFKTKNGQELVYLLNEWNFSKKTLIDFPFLAFDFTTYPFIFGLLCSGGFCNSSSEETIHYVGGRISDNKQSRLTHKHLTLLAAYVWMHLQIIVRFLSAAKRSRSLSGLILSPLAGCYLFVRRIFVAYRNRINRQKNQ